MKSWTVFSAAALAWTLKVRDLKRNPGLIEGFRENPLLRFAKFDTAVENFKEGTRKAAGFRDGLGLETLKIAENGEWEDEEAIFWLQEKSLSSSDLD